MARQTTPKETTVRVETVGANEIADAVAARLDGRLKENEERIGRVHRASQSADGRLRARIKSLEAWKRNAERDLDTLFKMQSAQQTGVTVTRHTSRSAR